ncbi:MbtH family protein [Streptomyces sp. NBC_01255]|uniref:MbtH family protein n=1 Tax=Streptomyces sp. NBC_01255 TaxID=2903798 RepID=UPI002E37A8DA|nr:MbtH family protein [Streptomyces sp. NBC_01255]
MINPFANESGQFPVLVNGENQHSLRPLEFDIPAGWSTAFGPDLRAASLRTAMATAPH